MIGGHDELTLDDHRKAFTEVSFLIELFASTVDELVGSATASVGRVAGRMMGKRLPLHLPKPSLETVLEALARQLSGSFELSYRCEGSSAELTFGRCPIRKVCQVRDLPLDGETCRIFHAYFDGVVNELTARPTKTELCSVGERCVARLAIK